MFSLLGFVIFNPKMDQVKENFFIISVRITGVEINIFQLYLQTPYESFSYLLL